MRTSLSKTIKSLRDELDSNRDGLDGNRDGLNSNRDGLDGNRDGLDGNRELNSQIFSPQTLIACIFTAKTLLQWHFVDLLRLGRSPPFLFGRSTHILLLKTLANLLDLTAILRFLHEQDMT
jgi:hypothetical protein